MFLSFFETLRAHGVPASPREYLSFLAGLDAGLATYDVDVFYYLARTALVKNEAHLDRFDQAFAVSFSGIEAIPAEAVIAALDLPGDWLKKLAEKHLSAAEKAEIEALGGFEKLMATLRERLKEQQKRHQGGAKWIGTAGTSPFGAYGYNPEGLRIGQDGSRHQRAVKVWDKRSFRDLDDSREIGTRTIKVALKRLRQWAREGAADELDLDGTIRATAEHGYLDVKTRPERRNGVRVLLLLDAGGSMDPFVEIVEELFSAARSEFKHLDQFYFHNCLYEGVWRENARRWSARTPTWEVLNRFGPGWKCIFVGDASMSPYEIAVPGGANEHWNEESGETWLRRASAQWNDILWINPVPERHWPYTPSIAMVREIIGRERMVPLTLEGLARGMRLLG